MLRTQGIPVRDDLNVDAYEVWRACKDVERLVFIFQSNRQCPPAELERLQAWVKKIAAANDINLHSQ